MPLRQVAALVPDSEFLRLRRLLSDSVQVFRCPTGAALLDQARVGAAVVLDANYLSPEVLSELASALQHSLISPLIYSEHTQRSMRGFIDWASFTDVRYVVHGAHTEDLLLRQHIERPWEEPVASMFVRTLAPRLRRLHPALLEIIVGCIGGLRLAKRPSGLFPQVGVHRRTWERQLFRTGLCGAERILLLLRLMRLWNGWTSTLTLPQLASVAEFSSAESLRSGCRRVLGVSPKRLREHFSASAFVGRLCAHAVTLPD